MGRMRVGEWRVAGEDSGRARGGGVLLRGTALLFALAVALLALGQTSAGAVGLVGPADSSPLAPSRGVATSAAARAHEHGYSLTPSTTEPYLACPAPKPHQAACMVGLIPTVVARNHSPLGTPSEYISPDVSPMYEGNGAEGGLSPSDLRSAYDIPETGGSGQTVAIVDKLDDPNAEADMNVYRKKYGLPACTTESGHLKGCFKKVNLKGEEANYPAADKDRWGTEVSVDLDMVSAICSECHILLIETGSGVEEMDEAQNEAATLGATEISDSWAREEFLEDPKYDHYFDHPGIPITVGGGDYGYGVSYPAASPYVISVGGTTLTDKDGWQQSVWQGSGGGCSAYEPKPTWQTDMGCTHRTDNDVSAVASEETPVSIYDSYSESEEHTAEGWELAWGTSVATPIVAAVEAHASKAVREEGPEAFYRFSLNDVVKGADRTGCRSYLCSAWNPNGYSGPTGWGAPYGPMTTSVPFSAITARATEASVNGAIMNGYVYPEGKATTYQFEYGKTTSYGSKVPVSPASAGTGVVWQAVSQSVTGLEPETTYHYRLVATNSSGTIQGADSTFTTTGWGVQSDPSSEASSADMWDVSCSSSTACTAVGEYRDNKNYELAKAEYWNGAEWQMQSTPSPSTAESLKSSLGGVSCPSTAACTAVGCIPPRRSPKRRWASIGIPRKAGSCSRCQLQRARQETIFWACRVRQRRPASL